MALNFPSSPVDNEIYTDVVTGASYIYSAAYGVWNLRPTSNTKSIYDTANSGFLHANAAYDFANSITLVANAAFLHANAAFANANTVMVSAQAAFTVANSGFIHANSGYAFANSIAITANLAFAHANSAYANGNIVIQTAQSAFTQANLAFVHANNAFARANIANITADRAWNHANAAFANANTVMVSAQSAFTQANIAFANANTVMISAQAAFTVANSGFIHANSGYAFANSITLVANAAFLHANAAFANANTVMVSAQAAFTVANSSFLNANAAYAFANSVAITANLAFAHANSAYANGNTVIQTAQSAFTLANISYAHANAAHASANAGMSIANAAFATANIAFANANTVMVSAQAAFTVANSSFIHANSGYAFANSIAITANAALPNTSGVSFNGNLYFPSGNVGIGTVNTAANLHVVGSVITGKLQHSPVPISKLLTAFDAANSDGFGKTALSGDASTLAVGAVQWEGSVGSNRGGVYIYDWNGSSWIQRGSVLEASDAADGDAFGGSIALSFDGSTLAVGSYNWEGTTGTNRGAVYIYDWNSANSSWIQRGSVLEASDAADSDFLGTSVALSSNGSILAAGAWGWEGTTGTNRGGVYIYDWNSANSSWIQRGSVLEASDAADGDQFGGYAVSLSSNGSILAVGAFNWEGTTGTNRGGVYIFDWNSANSSWIQRGSVLEASDAADGDVFGVGVSLSSDGSILAIGAFNWEGTTGTNRGGVYIYDWNGSSWIQRGSVLEASDAADGDLFGFQGGVSLSSDGSILAVGAGQWEGTSLANTGAVYTYSLTGALPSYSGVATGSGWIEGSNSALIARTAGLDRIAINSSGNVGIGTISPTSLLHVNGTANIVSTLTVSNMNVVPTIQASYAFANSAHSIANLAFIHANNAYATANAAFPNTSGISFNGNLTVPGNFTVGGNLIFDTISAVRIWEPAANTLAIHTSSTERLRIDSAGNVAIGATSTNYKLEVAGSFAAQTKSFVINHQSKPGMKLRYGSLEGPENGVYVRGRTNSNTIELPDHWSWLVDENSITVSLTPIGKKQELYVKSVSRNKIVIGGSRNIDCFYTVYAERKDVDKLVVEF